ncbi:MAG TPA: hypothetical protein VIV66_21235 [Pyrinomonadaceae bacterium]
MKRPLAVKDSYESSLTTVRRPMDPGENTGLNDFESAYVELFAWCRSRFFAGYDPFDGLNSALFQATPLAKFPTARLLWTQLLKRAPLNARPILRVPQQHNAKGIALFALGALAAFRREPSSQTELQARDLLKLLLDMRIDGLSGAAWSYNFDWQSRNFFAPRGTPTVVPTAFAARALLDGARTFNDPEYLKVARSTCDFILQDLPIYHEADGAICFSYSPNSETQIFNASLLAAETLAEVGSQTGERELGEYAQRATRYVVQHQRDDGSWTYGTEPKQSWIDNFHTAYVLYSLRRIVNLCSPDSVAEQALYKGYEFWRECFFLADGWPKYYHDSLYPADTHAAASGVVTLLEFKEFDPNAVQLAERIVLWTLKHLRNPSGYFYYQRRRFLTIRTPFMRWTQAWMVYALACLLEARNDA